MSNNVSKAISAPLDIRSRSCCGPLSRCCREGKPLGLAVP